MMMKSTLNLIEFNEKELETLILSSLPYEVEGWNFPLWKFGYLGGEVGNTNQQLQKIITKLNNQLNENGYFVLNLNHFLENYPDKVTARVSTFILSLLGEPIKIFDGIDSHWRKVSVKLEKHPNKSEGVGLSPLHMDFVNAEYPPDYVCLFALQPDIRKGGQSILANFENVEDSLSSEDVHELLKAQFIDGKVENLSNIGVDINPFPIISNNSNWKYRITGNLLNSEDRNKTVSAVERLFVELEKRKISFLLEKGYFLVVNQHKMLHGKEPLGENQDEISIDNRRLLMHAFVKKTN